MNTPTFRSRPDPDDVTACFEVAVVVDAAVAPRVAVRAPAGNSVDVVNVEVGKQLPNGQREVVFVVEAERSASPWDVAVIVAIGTDEARFVGPTISPRTTA
jgi:hypothetical protein